MTDLLPQGQTSQSTCPPDPGPKQKRKLPSEAQDPREEHPASQHSKKHHESTGSETVRYEDVGSTMFNRPVISSRQIPHIGDCDVMVLPPLSIWIPWFLKAETGWEKRMVGLYHQVWGTWHPCCSWQQTTPPPHWSIRALPTGRTDSRVIPIKAEQLRHPLAPQRTSLSSSWFSWTYSAGTRYYLPHHTSLHNGALPLSLFWQWCLTPAECDSWDLKTLAKIWGSQMFWLLHREDTVA